MTTLAIDLQVKFRSFGITFGTVKETWRIPLDAKFEDILHMLPRVNPTIIEFDKRGVRLKVQLLVGEADG